MVFVFFEFIKSISQLKKRNKLGWLMGLEPTTTGITIQDSTN
jgi:hypothetical protein